MRVTRAKAQANRAHVVETASTLFRARGFDGIGVADLMSAAGLTHGGFYKQFGSKTNLMAESAACGIRQTAALGADVDPSTFVLHYLSRQHRDTPASGCTMAALGGDAARQPHAVRAVFAEGIERLLEALLPVAGAPSTTDADEMRTKTLSLFAHAVGALVMSRACPDDSPLADEILAASRNEILRAMSASAAEPASVEGAQGDTKNRDKS